MRGCVASARACDQSCAGQQASQIGDALRTAEQPDRACGCAEKRACALRLAEHRRLRDDRRRRLALPRLRRPVARPASRVPLPVPSASLAAHDQHAIARPHLARHPLPQCFGIELRGSRRTAHRRARELHRPRRSASRGAGSGRPGTGMVGPAGGRGPLREEMAHRVAADEHHGAIADRAAARHPAAPAVCGTGTIAIRGSATASRPRQRRSSTQRAASACGRVTSTCMAQRLSGRRRRAAARRRQSPSSPACARSAATAAALRPHQGGRSRPDRPRRRAAAGVRPKTSRARPAASSSCRPWRGSPRVRRRPPARSPGAPAAPAARSRSARSARTSMPSAPCPAAGSICSGSNTWRMRWRRPSRLRPAAASTMASYWPSSSLRRRVSRLPRSGFDLQVGPQRAQQHHAAQAGGADHGALRQVVERRRIACETRASRGSSRSITQASAKPSGRSIGTSLSECTAMSARPSSSATSSSLTNRPLPPTLLSDAVQDLVAARGHAQQRHLMAALLAAAPSRARPATGPGGFHGWR